MPKVAATARSMRKSARQARAQDTVRAIVVAAARILQSEGVEGLTTNHIAAVAGVSVGSLYQYFPNKEAVVVALIRDQLDRDDAHLSELVLSQDGDLRSGIFSIVRELCRYQNAVAPLLSELLPLLSPLEQTRFVEERFLEMTRFFEAFFLRAPSELRPELLDEGRRKRALWVGAHAMRAVLNQALSEPGLLLEPSFQEEVAELAAGYFLRSPE